MRDGARAILGIGDEARTCDPAHVPTIKASEQFVL